MTIWHSNQVFIVKSITVNHREHKNKICDARLQLYNPHLLLEILDAHFQNCVSTQISNPLLLTPRQNYQSNIAKGQ